MNSIKQLKPIPVNQKINAKTYLSENYETMKRGIQLEVITKIFNETNKDLLWECSFKVLCFTKTDPNQVRNDSSISLLPSINSLDNNSVQSISFYIPEDIGNKFSKINFDENPIHTNHLFAKLFGFQKKIWLKFLLIFINFYFFLFLIFSHGAWLCTTAISKLSQDNQILYDMINKQSNYIFDSKFIRPGYFYFILNFFFFYFFFLFVIVFVGQVVVCEGFFNEVKTHYYCSIKDKKLGKILVESMIKKI